MSEKRNIVLITLDSLRADHCSFMGYHRKTTPTIDKMARKGLYFENAIAASIDTPQSMFACFTGEYPTVEYDNRSPRAWRNEFRFRKTLAQVLSERGYTTYGIHANPTLSRLAGFNKGFKYYIDFLEERTTLIYNIINKITRKFGFSTLADYILKQGPAIDWSKIFEVIRTFNLREPFFMWVLLLDTHMPYLPPRKFRKYSNLFHVFWYNWIVSREARRGKKFNKKWRKKLIDIYDDCITFADTFIYELWEYLEKYDPIFIIHSDHGDGFYEHGFYGHYSPLLYEELIHVPLVIYNADIKGKREKPVSLLGMTPTILDLISGNDTFLPKSFMYEREFVVSKVFDGRRWRVAVRTKRWKFITGQQDVDELYDLKKDPYEQENIIEDHSDLAKELRKISEIHKKHIKKKIQDSIFRLGNTL